MKFLKYLAVIVSTGLTLSVFFGGLLALSFIKDLPEIHSLDDYSPFLGSRMYDQNGRLIARFSTEDREFIEVKDIPERVQQAFVAAEDASFFTHKGIDFISIIRAMIANIKAGAKVQGGSTITQQVAKSFLSTEKTFERKLKDALLAVLLELRLTKDEILYIYLNEIYLGDGAYGIQAASRRYFNKDVHEMNLGEMAILAGLPQAPSRYSPRRNPKSAIKRMNYVLDRMLDEKMIDELEHKQFYGKLPEIKRINDFFTTRSPYFAETVRKELTALYGKETIFNDGINIFTTVDMARHLPARKALWNGLMKLERRRGLREALFFTEPEEKKLILEFLKKTNRPDLFQTGYGLFLVEEVSDKNAKVTNGEKSYSLPLHLNFWTREPNLDKSIDWDYVESLKERIKPGQVYFGQIIKAKDLRKFTPDRLRKLIPRKKKDSVLLVEFPETQGAVLSVDQKTGYLITAVGGSDFLHSQFNRALQGCRQPGSNFKPFVYGAALDSGDFNPSSKLLDSPIYFEEDTTIGSDQKSKLRKVWKPSNYGKSVKGEVLMREALAHSINLPTIYLLKKVGIPKVIEFAQKLKIESELKPDLSLALGSSCVKPMELIQSYTNIASGGIDNKISYLKKVLDKNLNVLIDKTSYKDVLATPLEVSASLIREEKARPQRLIEEKTAYLLVSLLRNVIREGTARGVSYLNADLAGKTGTTNNSFDAWFSGFSRQLVTTVWVGKDNYDEPMNRYESGARAALPVWREFMDKALIDSDNRNFKRPDGIVERWINPKTGFSVERDSILKVLQVFDVNSLPKKEDLVGLERIYDDESTGENSMDDSEEDEFDDEESFD